MKLDSNVNELLSAVRLSLVLLKLVRREVSLTL